MIDQTLKVYHLDITIYNTFSGALNKKRFKPELHFFQNPGDVSTLNYSFISNFLRLSTKTQNSARKYLSDNM